uniref:Serine protease n=1 Tax=Coptotermes formosanus TaxID=36987 RepID=L0AVJ3_COPFO|nr:serine protease [Coptotermes formosanus]
MLKVLLFASLVACGLGAARLTRRRPRLDGRIVGGVPVHIEDFPYQLSYEYDGSHICGASIISTNWVVTAGHCVDGASTSYVRFRAGSSLRSTGGTLHPAAQLVLNPDYDYYTIDYDIAVARVSVPFTYGTEVQPIGLARTEPPAGTLAIVSGWGTLSSGSNSLPSQLQAVEVDIISRSVCNDAYAIYDGITARMICAGVVGGGKDACQGDSGGPLVAEGSLVGIVSWGEGCGEADYPGVYSNVANLKSFVTNATGVA